MQLAWSISILVSSPVLFLVVWGPPGGPRAAHSELLLGAGCIASVFAELFMIKSLVVFDPDYRPWSARLPAKFSAKPRTEASDPVGQSDDDVEEEMESAPRTPRWQPRWVRHGFLAYVATCPQTIAIWRPAQKRVGGVDIGGEVLGGLVWEK